MPYQNSYLYDLWLTVNCVSFYTPDCRERIVILRKSLTRVGRLGTFCVKRAGLLGSFIIQGAGDFGKWYNYVLGKFSNIFKQVFILCNAFFFIYHKIPNISTGLLAIFKHILGGLYSGGGLMFGGQFVVLSWYQELYYYINKILISYVKLSFFKPK